MHTPGPWYESSTGNHQGLIANEKTGEYIAVSYKKEDAALIATAPELFEALNNAKNLITLALANNAWGNESTDEKDSRAEAESVLDEITAAIHKAEGRP